VQALFLAGKRAVAREGGGGGGPQAAAARKKLLQLVKPRWDDLTRKFGVRQLHFHLGPGDVSFLRVHRPDKFGDDLSAVRHTILAVNETRKPVTGFETGRVVSGIRGAVPVFGKPAADGTPTYIGVLEAGTSFETLLRILRLRMNSSFAVILSTEHLRANIWPSFLKRIFQRNPPTGSFYVEAALDPRIKTLLRRSAVVALARDRGTRLIDTGSGWLAVTSLPLRDFLGNRDPTRPAVGAVLIWQDASAAVGAFQRALWVNIVYAIGGFLFIELLLYMGLAAATRRIRQVVDRRTSELRKNRALLEQRVEERTAELRTSNRRLRDSERRFRDFLEHAPVSVAIKDRDYRYQLVNRKFEALIGSEKKTIIGKRCRDVFPGEFATRCEAQDREVLHGGAVRQWSETLACAGGERTFETVKFPIDGADGMVTAIGEIRIDTTEGHTLEAQLRQAQKMEVVGNLSGGIAHDFNNLLAIIVGNLELLHERIPDDDMTSRLIDTALRSAHRGADLTKRLLAFSRQQPLHAKAIDVEGLVSDMMDMLHRALGEEFVIEAKSSAPPWHAEADATQLEAALLNLAVNARDAMPGGGRLTIEIANVQVDAALSETLDGLPPGPYVALSVSDTGTGMSPEVAAHVFEPFYTTKDVGRGSGLGFSMVYGFAKQSGGHVEIESAPDRGTTVRIYLRKAVTVDSDVSTASKTVSERPVAGETVLIVEDDDSLRETVRAMLDGLGYRVLAAEDGAAALRILKDGARIDLLLTDMALPRGLSGKDLGGQMQNAYPDLAILYMTGRTPDGTSSAADGGSCLQKPFRKAELSRKIREALNPRET